MQSSRAILSLFLFLSLSLSILKQSACVCVYNIASYSTNLSLEYLFLLSFWQMWNKNIQNEWLVTASFIFRVLKFLFSKRLVVSVGERRKSHVPLIIVALFCISLIVSSLSSTLGLGRIKVNTTK